MAKPRARIRAYLAPILASVILLATWAGLAQSGGPVEGARAVDAALNLGAEVSAQHAAAGATLVYTVTLGNTTPVTPFLVTMTDTLPVDLTLLPESVWSSLGTAYVATNTVTWMGQLEPSTTVTIGLAALARSGDTVVTNTVVADAGPFGRFESNPLVTTIDRWRTLLPLLLRDWESCILDDFSSPASGWPTGATPAWTVAYAPAGYTMRATKAPALMAVTRGDRVSHERFDYEVRVRSTSEDRGAIGLVYRITGNWTTFESLEIDPIGQTYALYHFMDGQWYERRSGQLSAIVPNGTNTLRVEWDYSFEVGYPSAQYSAYINGNRVYQNYYRLDNAPPPYGFGLIATSFTEGFIAIAEEYRLLPDGCGGLGDTAGYSAATTVSQAPRSEYTSAAQIARPPLVILSPEVSGDYSPHARLYETP